MTNVKLVTDGQFKTQHHQNHDITDKNQTKGQSSQQVGLQVFTLVLKPAVMLQQYK